MSNSPIILIETITGNQAQIIESYDNERNLYLNGIMMQTGIFNRNKRRYHLDEISQNVQNLQEQIANNSLMGELDHPNSIIVNLDRVSHIITDLRMVGQDAVGKAKILGKTPCGAIAKTLVESGVKIGFSSRGTGMVDDNGDVTGCHIVTVDLVGMPSAPGAVPKAIYESIEQYRNGEQIMTLAEAVQHDEAAQKYFEREIMNFLKTNIFKKK